MFWDFHPATAREGKSIFLVVRWASLIAHAIP
jgi:hypothetical protein